MDYSIYISILRNLESKNIIILAVTVAIFVFAIIIYKLKKNNFCHYMLKTSIVCLVLCCLFLVPQTIAIAIDLSKKSIVYEQDVNYKISNTTSTVNGFDYFADYNTVKTKDGNKLLIITSVQKLPEGEGTTNIIYAKHSRILLEYYN